MRLQNAMKMHAASMDAATPVARWGTVASNHPTDMTVKVTIQPEGVTTGWLPIASSMVGNGWGLVHKPTVGTPVMCLPDAGDAGNMVVVGATWSRSRLPPANIAEGELWLVHSTGSKIALTNDGKLMLADASGASLVFGNNGTATLTGTLNVTGNVVAGFGSGDQVGLQTHKHSGVQSGASSTNIPTAGT